MFLTVFVFFSMLLVVFAIVAFATRPTGRQNAMDRRLVDLVGEKSDFHKNPYQTDGQLLAREYETPNRFKTIVLETQLARYVRRMILQSQVNISLFAVLQLTAAFTLITGLLAWYLISAPLPAIALALIAGYLPCAYLRFRRGKRLAAFNEALPECIETCARSLKAGHSIVAAIDIVAEQAPEPAKTEFSEVFKKQNYGLPLRDALVQMLDRVPSPDLQVMITGFLVQRDTGGNLVEILDRLLYVIRERLRIQRDVRIHTAQGRLTGWILCLLPVALLVMINFISPGYSKILFTDPTGKKMLYSGAGLLLLGGFLIRQIINGIEV